MDENKILSWLDEPVESKPTQETQKEPSPKREVEDIDVLNWLDSTTDGPKSKIDKVGTEAKYEGREGFIGVDELKEILDRRGVLNEDNLNQLKDFAVFFGANVPGHKAPFADVLRVLDSATGNVAQKYSILKQGEEAQLILDELRELAQERKSGGKVIQELASAITAPAALISKTAKGAVGLGAFSGAVAGATAAKSGEELEGAIRGAPIGALMVGGFLGVGKLLSRNAKGEVIDVATDAPLSKEELVEVGKTIKMSKRLSNKQKIDINAVYKKAEEDSIDRVATMKAYLDEFNPEAEEVNFQDWWKAATNDAPSVGPLAGEQDTYLSTLLTPKQLKQIDLHGEGILPDEVVEMEISPVAWLAFQNFQKDLSKVSKQLGGQLKDRVAQEGSTFAAEQFQRVLKLEAAEDYFIKNNLVGTGSWSPIRKLGSLVQDVKPLAQQFDRKYNSSFEGTIDSISVKLNKISSLRASALSDLKRLKDSAKEAKVSAEDIYEALDSGNMAKGGVEEVIPTDLYNAWKDYFSRLGGNAQQLGLPLKMRENYVPYHRPEPVQYSLRIDEQYKKMPTQFKRVLTGEVSITPEAWSKIIKRKDIDGRTDAVGNLLGEMEIILGVPRAEIKTPARFNELVDVLRNPNAMDAVTKTRARALIERTDEGTPDWIREKNVFEVAKNYVTNTYRHAALRDELAELELFQDMAARQGDGWTAKYVNRLQQDIVGGREETIPAYLRTKSQQMEIQLNRLAKEAEEKGDSIRGRVLKGMTYTPEVFNMMSNAVYPNMLGLSPRSAFQNLASGTIMNLPELGTVYGTKVTQKGLAKAMTFPTERLKVDKEFGITLLEKANREPEFKDELIRQGAIVQGADGKWIPNVGANFESNNVDLILNSKGILPAQWTGELISTLRNETKKSALYHTTSDMVDKWTSISMAMFEFSEKAARMQTYHVAKEVAADLNKGATPAKEWLRKVSSPYYNRELTKAVRQGDTERVEDLTIRYFQSTNLFNYDKANMSEFGRTMGPLFSVFSKWPTHMVGRVINELDRGSPGIKKMAVTLVAPYLLMQGVDLALPDRKDSPAVNLLVGQGGLRGMTPLSSVKDAADIGIQRGPAAQILGMVAEPIFNPTGSSVEKVSKGTQQFISTFVPFANIPKFTGQYLPQMMGINIEKRRKKGGVLERQIYNTQRTLRKLGIQ